MAWKPRQLPYTKRKTIPVFLSESGVVNTVHELTSPEFARSQKPSPKCPQQVDKASAHTPEWPTPAPRHSSRVIVKMPPGFTAKLTGNRFQKI